MGKTLSDKFGVTEKLGGTIYDTVNITTEVDKKELRALKKDIQDCNTTAQVDVIIKEHGLSDIEGLPEHIKELYENGNVGKLKASDLNEFITAQNYQNIADQAKGFKGVTSAINEYNKGIKDGTLDTGRFLEAIDKTNPKLAEAMKQYNNGAMNLGNYVKYLIKASAKTMLLKAATTGLDMVFNGIISMAASFVMSKIISGIDELIVTEKEAEEAFENAKSSAKSYADTLADLKKQSSESSASAKELADSYSKLVQGVNTFNNENVSLSNDDYEEFLEINGQLADLFPSLTKGYDENGNAILGLGGSIETVTGKIEALVEQQERLTRAELSDNLQKYVEGDDENGGQIDVIRGYQKQLKEAEKIKKEYNAFQRFLNGEDVTEQELSYDTVNEIYKKAGIDASKIGWDENQFWDTSFLNTDELETLATEFRILYSDIALSAKNAETQLKSANEDLSSQMMIWVEDLPTYAEGGETFQRAIAGMVSSIKWDEFNIDGYEGAQDFIRESVLTPISMVAEDPESKAEVTNALTKLFSVDFSQMPVKAAEKEIAGYLAAVMDSINAGITDDSQKKTLDDMYAMFGMSDYESIADNIGAIAKSNMGDMKTLSDYTREFTWSQWQAWLTATKGADWHWE